MHIPRKVIIRSIDMNILFDNPLTLIYENGQFIAKKASICVSDDRIVSVGSIPADFIPDRTVSGKHRMAIPPLINCHTHSYMSILRNLADDLPFAQWLFDNILPREDKITPDMAYAGAMLSCMEMIKTGTSSFIDMHMFPGMTARAAQETGMRAVMSRGLVDDTDEGGERRIKEVMDEIEQFRGCDRISHVLGPHAIYTCSEKYLRRLVELAKEKNMTFNIHLSESKTEVDDCVKAHGMSPVAYLDNMGFFDIPTIAAHCVHVSEEDMDILAEKKVWVAHNPKSNLKLGNGIAPVKRMLEKGVNVCLGTDSQASNNALNMFSEMNFAALIHKGVSGDAAAVSAQDVLSFATVNAAQALKLDGCGEIKAGAKADICLLNTDCPQLTPQNNPVSALAYSANGSEVVSMMVDGEIIMENGSLTKADEEKILFEAAKLCR